MIEFTEPDFKVEWVEAKRYPTLFLDAGDWLNKASMGKPASWIDVESNFGPLGNTDAYNSESFPALVIFKRDRFLANFEAARIEMTLH